MSGEDAFSIDVTASSAVVGCILAVVLLSGPVGGIDLTGEQPQLGDGTASVTVKQPDTETIAVTDGRFGTNVSYVRIPDLVLSVSDLSSQPRVVYTVRIPGLDVEKSTTRLVHSTGRLRVPLADQALVPKVESGTYRGQIIVRIQSFSGGETVLNRSVRVVAE